MFSFIEKIKGRLLPPREFLDNGVVFRQYAFSRLCRYSFQMTFGDPNGFRRWYQETEQYLKVLGFTLKNGAYEGETLVAGCEFCALYPMRIDTVHVATTTILPLAHLLENPRKPVVEFDIHTYDITIDIPESAAYPKRDWKRVVLDIRNIGTPTLSAA